MKLKLLFQNGIRADKSVEFHDVSIVNLGGKNDNDMVFNLPEDTDVAPYHTQIRQIDETVFIQDMGSASGTFLNGQRISKTQIADGDVVQLGIGGPRFEISLWQKQFTRVKPTNSVTRKIYGQKTVGMMIQQALKSAGSSVNRTTSYFEAMLENRLNLKTRRYRIAVALIFALLVVMGTVLGFYVYNTRQMPMVKLLATESDAAEQIARSHRHNIYLLAGMPRTEPKDSNNWQGFCTGFAIGPNVLATNAHCVEKAQRMYREVWALMNLEPQKKYRIQKLIRHPEYLSGSITPDVGLLQISAILDSWVQMAAQSELKALEQGSFVYIYGFPGRLSNLAAPVATFVRGEIGRVTNIHQQIGPFEKNILLQHSAVISEGTSGSPMFNLNGNVVGINAGGYAAEGKMMSGYNFGIRIDAIAPLLQAMDTTVESPQ
jgi:S1-C subfamily serine protease